jgi:hypothetical protein
MPRCSGIVAQEEAASAAPFKHHIRNDYSNARSALERYGKIRAMAQSRTVFLQEEILMRAKSMLHLLTARRPRQSPFGGANAVKMLLTRLWSENFALLALAVAIANPSCWAQTRTLTFDSGDEVDTVSFDPAKISEAQLRQLILFSPFISSYFNNLPARDFSAAGSMQGDVVDKMFFALPLELCMANDPAYSHCEANSIGGPNFLHNAKVNLERSQRGLKSLQNQEYPNQLQPVVKFLLDGLAFSLRIEEARFRYYSTWDENVLKEAHDEIDPVQLCPDIFRKLEGANSKEEKYGIMRIDWANCMITSGSHKLGLYPISSWNAFLKTYDITEHFEMKGPD